MWASATRTMSTSVGGGRCGQNVARSEWLIRTHGAVFGDGTATTATTENWRRTRPAATSFLLYQLVLDTLDGLEQCRLGSGIAMGLTGWTDVDRQVAALERAYAAASVPEGFRQVGLLCRSCRVRRVRR